MIKAAYEALEEEVPDVLVNAATGMSGGLGFSGCVCGALNGAVMILGYRFSGDRKTEAKARSKSSKLTRWFSNRFSTTCCLLIREKRAFTDKVAKKKCMEATAETARELVRLIAAA